MQGPITMDGCSRFEGDHVKARHSKVFASAAGWRSNHPLPRFPEGLLAADITARNLGDGLKRRLRLRAAVHSRSVENVREILFIRMGTLARSFPVSRRQLRSSMDVIDDFPKVRLLPRAVARKGTRRQTRSR